MNAKSSTSREPRRSRSSAGRHRFRPGVEAMEGRQMLAGGVAAAASAAVNPDRLYVEGLGAALDRGKLRAAEVTALTHLLRRGVAPERVVRLVMDLPLTRRIEVAREYQALLGRAPSRRETAAGLALLRRGRDLRAVMLSILASRAFYAQAGGTPSGYVNALYQRVLGQGPQPGEAAAGLALLAAGKSRRHVAAQVVDSPELMSRLLAATQGRAPTPAEVMSAGKILGRPFSLESLLARTLASTAPGRLATGAASAAAPLGITYNSGLPLGQQWDLGTRWTPLASSPLGIVIPAIATAPDGTVWEALKAESSGVGGLALYNPQTNSQTLVATLPAQVTSIAALSATEAWVALSNGQGVQVTIQNGDGIVTPIPSLPDGNTFAQLSAGTDGTIWALGNNGQPYYYNLYYGGWLFQATDNYRILSISVGSATNVWAVAQTDAGVIPVQFGGGNWQARGFPASAGSAALVSATADGSAWVVTAGNQVYLWTAGSQTFSPATAQTPPGPLTAISGISQYRLNAISAAPNVGPFTPPQSTLELLTYGVADQPPTPFPAMDAAETNAYNDVSQMLGVTAPGGIRAEYDDPLRANDLVTWKQDIMGYESDPAPSNTTPAAWLAVTKQLDNEVTYANDVVSLFTTVDNIPQEINSAATDELTTDTNLVQLSTGEQNNALPWYIVGMFEAVFAGVAASFSGGGAVVAAILASSFDTGISLAGNVSNPDYSTEFQLTKANLSTLLTNIYEGANLADGRYEDAILTDWGRLDTVGSAIESGSLSWNYDTGPQVAAVASNGFSQYFFQTLMPIRWNIVSVAVSPSDVAGLIPSYDQYYSSSNDLWYIHDQGGSVDVYRSTGPFPLQELLSTIYATGVSQQELFTGANGWLNVVQGNTFQNPAGQSAPRTRRH